MFEARHNSPRCGRVLLARGRDAADVPFVRTFGAHQLDGFTVITEEIPLAASGKPAHQTEPLLAKASRLS